ncbi:MAG: NAD(P)H-binding protein [Candidatus Competibacteraceae bacterium]|nr:NAD(P)H-binding protein [Candidatus Competibacteraceae bacterium]
MSDHAAQTVLVLGAYGIAGRAVVEGLVKKTALNIIASGRNPEKLSVLLSRLHCDRLQTCFLDIDSQSALRQACANVDLVINCVGPYSVGGFEIARQVINCGKPYIDCANEQAHYRRLQSLDHLARDNNVMLLTAAGQTPGISTFFLIHAAGQLPQAHTLEMFCVQGRLPDSDAGMGSLLGALLEPSFEALTLKNGHYVAERMGVDIKTESMPLPFGDCKMLGVPIVDTLLVPAHVTTSLRSLQTYYSIGVEPPWGTFALIRILKPHRRKWLYNLLRHIVRRVMRKDFQRALNAGFDTSGFMKFIAHSASQRWQAVLAFDDGGTITSYIPVLAAKKIV